METRLGHIRRLVPAMLLLCAAASAVAVVRASAAPWSGALFLGLLASVAVMHRLRFRTVHRDGSVFEHHPGELVLAFAIAVGTDPYVAAMFVALACSLSDVSASTGRSVAVRTDWQLRTKLAVSAAANVLASIASWAAVTAAAGLLPSDHAATGLLLGTVAGLTFGTVGAAVLGPTAEWVATGRTTWSGVVRHPQLVPVGPLAAAGGVLAALVMEVHPVAALIALAGAWPLPALLRRRNELEERHHHVLRLLAVAADTERTDRQDVAVTIAATVAELLHYDDGDVRDAPPVAPDEIGTQLADGSWLVLSSPSNLALPDPYDRPTLDGLGLLACGLIEAGRARAARDRALKRDALTGLANRAGMVEAVGRLPRRSALVVAFLDLNGFKPINDRFGHDAGDAVLAEIGRRLTGQLRGSDVAARVGGDEFVLVMPGPSDPIAASEIVRRLVTTLGAPVALGCGDEVTVDVAVGIAIGPVEEFTSLVTRADTAMYADKRRRVATAAEPRGGRDATARPSPSAHR